MPNINTLLREARESKGLSIKEAAKALKLRERHIQMLEDGRMTELASEIYLKGFLKTYTSWLNIDGSDVISKINHEKKKVAVARNSVPIVSIGFSYISDLARRPGINVFLLSTLLTVAIYIFWSGNHKNVEGVDMVNSLQQGTTPPTVSEKYSNVIEEYRGKDIVLFPHANVELKVTDTASGEEKINNLVDGDVFFLKIDDGTVLSANTPDAIEVLLDNPNGQEPVGTLNTILMQF